MFLTGMMVAPRLGACVEFEAQSIEPLVTMLHDDQLEAAIWAKASGVKRCRNAQQQTEVMCSSVVKWIIYQQLQCIRNLLRTSERNSTRACRRRLWLQPCFTIKRTQCSPRRKFGSSMTRWKSCSRPSCSSDSCCGPQSTSRTCTQYWSFYKILKSSLADTGRLQPAELLQRQLLQPTTHQPRLRTKVKHMI